MDEGKIRKGGYIAIGTCHTDPATGVVQVYVQSTLDSSNFHLKNTGTNIKFINFWNSAYISKGKSKMIFTRSLRALHA